MNKQLFATVKQLYERPSLERDNTLPVIWTDPYITGRWIKNMQRADWKEIVDPAIEWIIERIGPLTQETNVCHFRCGPGLYTQRLAEKKLTVYGIDFSKEVLDYAKAQAKAHQLDIQYILNDSMEMKVNLDKKLDLILLTGLDFSVLTPKQRANLLASFYQHLKPDGCVFMTVSSLRQFNIPPKVRTCQHFENGFWSNNPHYVCHKNFKYEGNLLLDKFVVVEGKNVNEVDIWHQCYSPQSIAEELSKHSFEVFAFFSNIFGDPLDDKNNQIALLFHRQDAAIDENFYLKKWKVKEHSSAKFFMR